ncbi:MAG: hypothetical protein Fur0032_13230 [Terrimicrobiaceae bacterium]
MKITHLFAGVLAVGFASAASAQTEITITGATAFRQATMQAIYNAYNSVGGGLGVSFNVAHDFTGNNISQLIASNKAIFVGTFPGIAGTTTIRTSFNGSTEGLNAIAGNNDPSFLTAAALANTGSIQGGTTSPTETLRPKFSFSDVYQSTSPVDNIVLNPVGSSAVGVVTFAMIANEGAPSNFTNVTIQQTRALWQSGFQPLSIFTGDPNDASTLVFATGRNDGSGTRSAYLTEWLYGAANTVNQYIVTTAGQSVNGTISAITLVPAGGNGIGNLLCPDGTGNASTLWGNDVLGNGGYRSGSALRGIMGRTSTSVDVYDGVNQTPVLSGANILLLTWLSTADSRNAAANGAKILAYNGVLVTPLATGDPNNFNGTGFSEADYKKITSGAYSAWSYQHLYHWGSLSTEEQAWRDAMVNTWLNPALQQTANGVVLTDMLVERADDGFPIFSL